ncbi:MAG TPA: glycosyltransferase family 4 protein [Terriglobales bacterium]|nr:glycosyltransferase family 4 protein [Terriglobales bacterium]
MPRPRSHSVEKPLRVLAITGGRNSPSRIPRVQQYVDPLRNEGVLMREASSLAGSYPPERKWLRPAWAALNIASQVPGIVRSHLHDVTFLQREMLSTFVTLEPLTARPRVLDIDDAIWIHRRGSFTDRLFEICDHVICGNDFLAAHVVRRNRNVTVIPTAVDTDRFTPAKKLVAHSGPVIGWFGVSSGFRFLYSIEPALSVILKKYPDATLCIISNRRPRFREISADRVEYIPYTRSREVDAIRNLTVGLMPLDDTDWSRGKCSYKMLLYMACGIPVVVSPVGMNCDVLAKGDSGLAASSESDWIDALDTLIANAALRSRMGRTGRFIVQQHYSLHVLTKILAYTLRAVAS